VQVAAIAPYSAATELTVPHTVGDHGRHVAVMVADTMGMRFFDSRYSRQLRTFISQPGEVGAHGVHSSRTKWQLLHIADFLLAARTRNAVPISRGSRWGRPELVAGSAAVTTFRSVVRAGTDLGNQASVRRVVWEFAVLPLQFLVFLYSERQAAERSGPTAGAAPG
jgi:hypothetical protein